MLNFWPGILIGGLVGGTVGGFLTGLFFRWLEPGFGWPRVIWLSAVWAACGVFTGMLAAIDSIFALIIGLPFSVFGGSAFLFWLLWRAYQSANPGG
jgi:hypothetical protein